MEYIGTAIAIITLLSPLIAFVVWLIRVHSAVRANSKAISENKKSIDGFDTKIDKVNNELDIKVEKINNQLEQMSEIQTRLAAIVVHLENMKQFMEDLRKEFRYFRDNHKEK